MTIKKEGGGIEDFKLFKKKCRIIQRIKKCVCYSYAVDRELLRVQC